MTPGCRNQRAPRGLQTPSQAGAWGACPVRGAGTARVLLSGGAVPSGMRAQAEQQEEEEALPRPEGAAGPVSKGGAPGCTAAAHRRRAHQGGMHHLHTPCSDPWFNQQRKPPSPDEDAGKRGNFK